MQYDNSDIEKYISSFKTNGNDMLTYEKILTTCIVTTRRLTLDIESLEEVLIRNKAKNIFTLLAVGTKLESIRLEIEQLLETQK